MNGLLNKIIGDLQGKKEWKAIEARANSLPQEYRTVYNEIKNFVWHGGVGAIDPTDLFTQIVDKFEAGIAAGKHVLEVTGDDVATFVDSLVHDKKTYEDSLREELNRAITKKLEK